MAEESNGSGAASFVWAIALIIIVGLFALLIWRMGIIGGGDKKIDVEIKTPAASQ